MKNTKKTILFINESLACAGGEKSLLNLLSTLDYEKYDVSLQLFKYGCSWDKYIDPRVNILPPIPYTEFTDLSLSKAILFAIRHNRFNWLFSRLRYSISLRLKKNLLNIPKSCLYWKAQHSCFGKINYNYDYIIAYAQGIPTFFVADKAPISSKKIAWINATYLPEKRLKPFIEKKYNEIDTVVAVSEGIKEIEANHFPSFNSKLACFRDLINPDTIQTLSKEDINLKKDTNRLTIITLGRLSSGKGYDIAIDAADYLKSKQIPFIWYILGVGELEEELKQEVSKRKLTEYIKFLGVKENPYPYLKMADIYVQTSRYEGFGLAIAEARILNIPVVTTRFNNVFMQMIEGENGLTTDLYGESVGDAIIKLYRDHDLYHHIKTYLEKEKKGNLESIKDFYEVINR